MKSTSRRRTEKAKKHKWSRATPAQIGRQIGLILIVLIIWSGLLLVYLSLTSSGGADQSQIVAVPEATEVFPATESVSAATTAAPTLVPEATAVSPALPSATDPLPSPTDTPLPLPPTSVSFAAEVLPILTSRCQRCHGGERTEEELNLLSYAGVMAGSENGPVVLPGDSANSSLIQAIVSGEMPKRAPRLPASEIGTISNWVDEGALDN